MKKRSLSRRDFLRASGVTAVGVAVAACAPATTNAPQAIESGAAAPAGEVVTLDVIARQPEYLNLQRQIWDIFERENPNIKINLFAVNEDETPAMIARIAGGYIPHIATTPTTTREAAVEAYKLYMDLSELSDEDFPYWDRWTFDIKNAFTGVYELPGPRALDVMAPWTCT